MYIRGRVCKDYMEAVVNEESDSAHNVDTD